MTDALPDPAAPPEPEPGRQPSSGSLEWVVDQVPDRFATIDAASGAHATRAEYDASASALARGLKAEFGLGPGSRVAVALPASPELLQAQFAVAKLGAALLLVAPGLPLTGAVRLATVAGAAVLVVDGPAVTHGRPAVTGGPRVLPRAALAALAARHADGPRPLSGDHPPVDGLQVGGDGPGRVLLRVRDTERITQLARPFNDLFRRVAPTAGGTHLLGARAHTSEPQFWASLALVMGGGVVTQPSGDPAAILNALAEHQIASTVLDAATLRGIVALPESVTDEADLTALQRIVLDGPAPDAALVEACADLFGDDVLHRVAATPQTGPYAHASAEELAADPAALTTLDGVTLTRTAAGDVLVTSPLAADGALGGPADRGAWPAPPAWTGSPVPASDRAG